MPDPIPSAVSLREALDLTPIDADSDAAPEVGRARTFTAIVHQGWDIRGVPHGGYLLAMMAEAGARVGPQTNPVSVSANYLAPPQFGPAQLVVTPIRIGKRQTVHQVVLSEDGVPRVEATVTLATLPDTDPKLWADDAAAPSIPGPDECHDIAAIRADTPGEFRLHERLTVRLHPDVGWLFDRPTGSPQLDGWMQLTQDTAPDLAALLVFSDGIPPSIFEALGTDVGHVPTIQLTTHLFAKPAPGWVQGRCRTRIQSEGFIDEDTELWDSTGRLVGTARQLALVRPPS